MIGDDTSDLLSSSSRIERVCYTVCFLFFAVLSIAFRDSPPGFLSGLPAQSACRGDDACLSTQQVLRLSLSGSAFFAPLAALVALRIRVPNVASAVFGLVSVLVLAQLVPNAGIGAYAELARIGSGFFLLLQLVLIMDFVYSANEYLLSREDLHWLLIALSIALIGGFITLLSLLYYYFAPHALCSMNIGFITSILVLATGFTISPWDIHRYVTHAGLFTSVVVAVYCLGLTASALASEPDSHECKGFGHSTNDMTTVLGFVFSVVLILASIVRASTQASAFDMSSSSYAAEVSPITTDMNGLTFLLITFCLASMYFAMCLTSWEVDSVPDNYEVDKGPFSMWVKMCTAWAAAAMYSWTLVAPIVLTDRVF